MHADVPDAPLLIRTRLEQAREELALDLPPKNESTESVRRWVLVDCVTRRENEF